MVMQQTFEFLDQGLTEPELEKPEPEKPKPGKPEPEETEAEPTKPEMVASPQRDRESVLRRLRAQLGCVTTAPPETTERFSTGSDCVDRLLPGGGLRTETITEWVADADGCGAAAFSIIAAATRLRSTTGPLVVVGGQGTFYPPAAVALGAVAERIIWVRPTRHADVVWSIDQALRCENTAAVWAHIGPNLDDRDARRFQLAAEIGHTPGLFVRTSSVRGRPSFAEVRFHVAARSNVTAKNNVASGNHSVRRNDVADGDPRPGVAEKQDRVMRITLDRCRGGTVGKIATIRIDDRGRLHTVSSQPHTTSLPRHSSEPTHHETAAVRLASELAHPTSTKYASRQRRA